MDEVKALMAVEVGALDVVASQAVVQAVVASQAAEAASLVVEVASQEVEAASLAEVSDETT